MTLSSTRCFNHANREAVARCPTCTEFFCRECVTDYEARIICTGCLADAAQADAKGPHAGVITAMLAGGAQLLCSLLLLWVLFYALGQGLMLIPSKYHENKIWLKADGDP